MKNKVMSILVLAVIAAGVIYLQENHKIITNAADDPLVVANRPLPELTSPKKRIESYTPTRGDIKYRVVQKYELSTDPATNWNVYTSKEFSFSFEFPASTTLESTENLGYQLPPNLAYKGSRDTFEIEMTNREQAYYLFFLNDPNFSVPSTTVDSSVPQTINDLSMTKQILVSTDPQFKSSEIIDYAFEHDNKKYVWYGAFDSQDVESINDFESIVQSIKFSS